VSLVVTILKKRERGERERAERERGERGREKEYVCGRGRERESMCVEGGWVRVENGCFPCCST